MTELMAFTYSRTTGTHDSRGATERGGGGSEVLSFSLKRAATAADSCSLIVYTLIGCTLTGCIVCWLCFYFMVIFFFSQ